jgi:outer membrane lipoprotein carrier protein
MKHRYSGVLGVLLAGAVAGCGGPDGGDVQTVDGRPGGPPGVAAPVAETVPLPGAGIPGETAPGTAPGASVDPADLATSVPPGQAPAAPATGAQPVTSAPAPQADPQPALGATDANEILNRAERTYAQVRSMEADFVQQVYVPLLQSTQHSRGRIFNRMPDRFLMRFAEPQGDIIVADGRYFWMYYPSTDARQVMRTTLAQGGQQVDLQREFLSDASQRFTAVRTGSENIGGRQTHALTLTPRTPSPYTRIRLWVDAQDFLVRQFEITEQNETVRRLQLSNIRTNVNLSDELFRFTPPPGAQIFEP